MRRVCVCLLVSAAFSCDASTPSLVRIDANPLYERAALEGITLERLTVEVSGPDFARLVVEIDQDTGIGAVEVPIGAGRRFTIDGQQRLQDGRTFPVFVGQTLANVRAGPQEVVIPFTTRGAVEITGAVLGGGTVPRGTTAIVTNSVTRERAPVTFDALTPLALGSYTGQASVSEEGEVATTEFAFDIRIGELSTVDLVLVPRSLKCDPSAPADVRAAAPSCRAVSVSVTGLSAGAVTVSLNAEEELTLSEDGTAVFDTELPEGSSFAVTVVSAPIEPRQLCIPDGLGTVGAAGGLVTVECGEPFLTASVEVFGEVGAGAIITAERTGAGGGEVEILGNAAVSELGVSELSIPLPTAGEVAFRASDFSSPGVADVNCSFLDNTSLTLTGLNPLPLRLLCLEEPEPLYGNRSYGTWLVSGAEGDVRTASGAPCDPGVADLREECFLDALVREIRIPRTLVNSCNELSLSGLPDGFDYLCEIADTDAVITTAPLETPVRLSDFWTENAGSFEPLDFAVEVASSQWSNSALTPFAPWFDNPVIDTSTVDGDLAIPLAVYAITNERQTVSTLTGQGASLVEFFGGSISVAESEQAIVLRAPFLHIEANITVVAGSPASFAEYVLLDGADFATLSEMSMNVGSASPGNIRIINSSHSLVNAVSTIGGSAGIVLQGASDGSARDNRVLNTSISGTSSIGINATQPQTRVEDCTIEDIASVGLIVGGASDHSVFRDIRIARAGTSLIRSSGPSSASPSIDVRFIDITGDNSTGSSEPAMQFQFHSASRFVRIRSSNNQHTAIRFNGIERSLVKNVTGALSAEGFNTVQLEGVTTSRVESLLGWASGSTLADAAVFISGSTDNRVDGLAGFNDTTSLGFDGEDGSIFAGDFVLDGDASCVASNLGVNAGLDSECLPIGGSTFSSFLQTSAGGFEYTSPPITALQADTPWLTPEGVDFAFGPTLVPVGSCVTPTCSLVELRPSSDQGLNRSATVGANTLVPVDHVWGFALDQEACDELVPGSNFQSGSCISRYLPYTGERKTDSDSNRDGLCDVESICDHYVNVGFYQGHGGVNVVSGTVDFDGRSVQLERAALLDNQN